jgi:hypothetical protein
MNLEKANRKGAKAQRLAKTMHYMESAVLLYCRAAFPAEALPRRRI